MSIDIVVRLEALKKLRREYSDYDVCDILRDAIREIQRLREEIAALKEAVTE